MKITDILSEEEQVETTANANMAPFFCAAWLCCSINSCRLNHDFKFCT